VSKFADFGFPMLRILVGVGFHPTFSSPRQTSNNLGLLFWLNENVFLKTAGGDRLLWLPLLGVYVQDNLYLRVFLSV